MRRLAVALLTLGALTGCGGLAVAGGAPPAGTAPAEATRPVPPLGEDRRILHVLNRLAFGPRPGDVARVRAVGLDAWIDRQLRPETIDDSATERALVDLASLRMSIPEALREYPRPDPNLREKLQNGRMTRPEVMETYPPEKRPFRIAAELQAAKALRAVRSERQLAEVMVDFWFNHFNVFAGKGAARLREFGGTLAAFAQDLGDRVADVVVLTMSEFGRTVGENGNRGTDHGHATAMLVLGGGVRGGRVYGRWPGLARERLFEARDLAVTTDFRTLFSEVARRHLGAPTAALFPGWKVSEPPLGLFA